MELEKNHSVHVNIEIWRDGKVIPVLNYELSFKKVQGVLDNGESEALT